MSLCHLGRAVLQSTIFSSNGIAVKFLNRLSLLGLDLPSEMIRDHQLIRQEVAAHFSLREPYHEKLRG